MIKNIFSPLYLSLIGFRWSIKRLNPFVNLDMRPIWNLFFFIPCWLNIYFRLLNRNSRIIYCGVSCSFPCPTAFHFYYYYNLMLRGAQKDQLQYFQKPRKLVKINVAQDENYNEFKGEIVEMEDNHRQYREKQDFQIINVDYDEQKKQNQKIFQYIKSHSSQQQKIRSIKGASKQKNNAIVPPVETKKQQVPTPTVEKQTTQTVKVKQIPKKKHKVVQNGLNNWQKFLTNSQNTIKGNSAPIEAKKKFQFVAIDCQFVKSNDQQLLARVSIVDEHENCLLDTYVHPDKKITDFVTQISGITYTHIKNAPNTKTIIQKMKKILYSKIVVGHTIWKDLQVCGLKTWKGWKAVVDINEYIGYKQKNGKLISLKNLSNRFLGKKIQDGRHSSLQDAAATMNLFILKKTQILKQLKIIA